MTFLYLCFAAGLALLLLDFPFEIVGLKQIFWTYHDTDPFVAERTHSAPFVTYYYLTSSAAGFMILFRGTKALIGHGRGGEAKMEADGCV